MSAAPYFAPWSVNEGAFTIGQCAEITDSAGFPFAEIASFDDEWTFGEVLRANLILAAPKQQTALKAIRAMIEVRNDIPQSTEELFRALHKLADDAITEGRA